MEYKIIHHWDEELWQRTKDIYLDAFEKHGGKPEKIIRNMFAKGICYLHVLLEKETVTAMALTGSLEGAETMLIDYFAVKRQFRGQGVGQRFFDDIKKWANANAKNKRILIEVEIEETPENQSRISFWEKSGFRLVKDYIHHYIWVPEPYQAMILDLKKNESPPELKGEDCFKYISTFHKESFRNAR